MLDAIKTAYALKNGVNQRDVYNWHAPVFLFTNENIAGYLKQMNSVAGKSVLTVAASGDHAFECVLNGASHIDTFDINYLQKHVMELKAKMIKHLPYYDFMRFFFSKKQFFDHNIIKPIWHTFSPGLRVFLNKYYKTQNSDTFRYQQSQATCYTVDKISYINDEQAYKHLGHVLPNQINFKQTDLMNITDKFNTVYDTILLSNISEYLYEETPYTAGKIITFLNTTLSKIADEMLNENNGQICFHYAWRASSADYELAVAAIKQQMRDSIDCFDTVVRDINIIPVRSACIHIPNEKIRPDIALTMTQKLR